MAAPRDVRVPRSIPSNYPSLGSPLPAMPPHGLRRATERVRDIDGELERRRRDYEEIETQVAETERRTSVMRDPAKLEAELHYEEDELERKIGVMRGLSPSLLAGQQRDEGENLLRRVNQTRAVVKGLRRKYIKLKDEYARLTEWAKFNLTEVEQNWTSLRGLVAEKNGHEQQNNATIESLSSQRMQMLGEVQRAEGRNEELLRLSALVKAENEELEDKVSKFSAWNKTMAGALEKLVRLGNTEGVSS